MQLATSLRRLAAIASAAAVIAGGLTFSAPTAQAAAYDGQYPSDTKCGEDGKAVSTKTIPGTHSDAQIWLMYSKSCRTTWAMIVFWPPYDAVQSKLKGWIHRNSDGKQYNVDSPWTEGLRESRMVNDANVSSYAAGQYNGGTIVKTANY